MAKMLDGTSDDVLKENHKALCADGMSEAQAWHLVLKKANKGKAAERAMDGVTAKPKNKVKVK